MTISLISTVIKIVGFFFLCTTQTNRFKKRENQSTLSHFGKCYYTLIWLTYFIEFCMLTFQAIRTWATGRRPSEPHTRPDSFLERFAMAGPGKTEQLEKRSALE